MTRILVLTTALTPHEKIGAVAAGARSVAGSEVTVKRTPELMPEHVARKAGAKLGQKAPISHMAPAPSRAARANGSHARTNSTSHASRAEITVKLTRQGDACATPQEMRTKEMTEAH